MVKKCKKGRKQCELETRSRTTNEKKMKNLENDFQVHLVAAGGRWLTD